MPVIANAALAQFQKEFGNVTLADGILNVVLPPMKAKFAMDKVGIESFSKSVTDWQVSGKTYGCGSAHVYSGVFERSLTLRLNGNGESYRVGRDATMVLEKKAGEEFTPSFHIELKLLNARELQTIFTFLKSKKAKIAVPRQI